MSSKSKVFWASPNEVCYFDNPIRNDRKNMKTNNLVKTRLILDKILDFINSGDRVGIKVHVGEAYNTRYLRHDYVHEVVEAVKSKGGIPTLIETQGIGLSVRPVKISKNYNVNLMHRTNKEDHDRISHLHGYSESLMGVTLKFIDGDKGAYQKNIKIEGIHFKDVSVAAGLFEYDKIIAVSHFKGHPQGAFGGALKQLGMGCVATRNKFLAHFKGNLMVNSKACNISKCAQECIEVCPINAIKIENDSAVLDVSTCIGCLGCLERCPVLGIMPHPFRRNKQFIECVMDNAAAVLASFSPENIRYINFALDVTLVCDCIVNASVPIVPDLGIFASSDPLAIDKACIDAETNAPGLPFLDENGEWSEPLPSGVEKFGTMNKKVDPSWQLDAAFKNKLGTIDYELVKI
ncbi:MAG: DUF362 domain-containing protein [Candidatus Lokiarchaeota archaeon]|nr:DUF362 domain-containing protein [Candidatus Lokiarchaeota archaeon]